MPTQQSKPARRGISRATRFEVFKRDSFTCQYCQRSGHDVVLHLDHIFPVALGGDNRIENLVTSCEACNLGKSSAPLTKRDAPVALPIESSARTLSPFLSHSESAVHLALWALGTGSGESRTVSIGYEGLATHARSCKRTVQRLVQKLTAKGFVKVLERGTGRDASRYLVMAER